MASILREINRQMKAAAREAQRREREQERARAAAIREAERTRKAEERAAAQLARATAAERKRLEKEAKAAHVAAMIAQADNMNAELADKYEQLDNLLNATLDVDDFVDLDELKREVEHPPFDPSGLDAPIVDRPQPKFIPPPPLTGLGKVFKKGKQKRAMEDAEADYKRVLEEWEAHKSENQTRRDKAAADLDAARERYAQECAGREVEVAEQNAAIEKLKGDLAYGASEAVEEYIDIVLSNSIYPDWFPVSHRFQFDPSTAELSLTVLLPDPKEMPTAKAYKYQKSGDEIVESSLSNKACKDRFLSIVEQVALRTLHEVFEADRRGLIKSISLTVGTETVNPATGLDGLIPFAGVAAERESFLELDLSRVVPAATLNHLGAAVSKNPFELVAVDISGVRRSE